MKSISKLLIFCKHCSGKSECGLQLVDSKQPDQATREHPGSNPDLGTTWVRISPHALMD